MHQVAGQFSYQLVSHPIHSFKKLTHLVNCSNVFIAPRLKTSQIVRAMFPGVDKSGTSCYYLVARFMRPADLQRVVPTSLIAWYRLHDSKLLRTDCQCWRNKLEQVYYLHQPWNKVVMTHSKHKKSSRVIVSFTMIEWRWTWYLEMR